MAGFEGIVRPAIFPNIRPAQARPIASGDKPDKGFCVIRGSSGQTVDLSSSYSVSSSQSRPVETSRRVDTARIYQEEDSGTINRNNFVDVEVANRIDMDDAAEPQEGDAPGVRRSKTKQGVVYYYQPAKEADNIEIKERNKIKKADQ